MFEAFLFNDILFNDQRLRLVVAGDPEFPTTPIITTQYDAVLYMSGMNDKPIAAQQDSHIYMTNQNDDTVNTQSEEPIYL